MEQAGKRMTGALLALIAVWQGVMAQEQDSLRTVPLQPFEVIGREGDGPAERLPDLHGTAIMAGKKNEVLRLSGTHADLSTNLARQVFAKAPGITVWENDGSGIQTSIAARGLSPNRSWEFNVRQNGHDIAADIFGYPEAYYAPPLEAVERIEVVRGAAALQYGPQFGGLVDYRLKRGDFGAPLEVELRQTVGSYGLINTYGAVSGGRRRLGYAVFVQRRSADGWRANSRYLTTAAGASITLAATKRLELGLDYTRSDYVSQQAGGLTDEDFRSDARMSHRARNWFSAPWNVAALTADLRVSDRTRASLKVFGTLAERNSVGFLRPVVEPDTFQTATGGFAPRQVDRDGYRNAGAELRWLHQARIGSIAGHVSGGLRAYHGSTRRRQRGVGTTGSDFDLGLAQPFPTDLDLRTDNAAFFLELLLRVGKRLSVVPGARVELIRSTIGGRSASWPGGALPGDARERRVLLYGLGAEYKVSDATGLYANYATAYRPVLFSELTPAATTDIIDPALRDAHGANADLGYRGALGRRFAFDVSVYHLTYRDRIGTLVRDGAVYRTNIGSSRTTGVEAYAEADILGFLAPGGRWGSLRAFASVALLRARYTRWENPAIADDPLRAIAGKRVEYAPERTERYGITYRRRQVAVTAMLHRVGDVYTDAANTEAPNAAATVGRIRGYDLLDASVTWAFKRGAELTAGARNLADARYATRRAGGYPGPGLLPGEGRTCYLTVAARF